MVHYLSRTDHYIPLQDDDDYYDDGLGDYDEPPPAPKLQRYGALGVIKYAYTQHI